MRGAVINRNKLRMGYSTKLVGSYVKKQYFILVMGIIFIIGVWLGSNIVYQFKGEIFSNYSTIIGEYINFRKTQTPTEIFYNCTTASLSYVILLFFCGFCAISQPIIILIPLVKGLGFGLTMVGILGSGIEKPLIVALSIMPGNIISILMLFFCCSQSYKLSKLYLSKNKNNDEISHQITDIKQYLIKYAVYAIITILGCALEALAFYLCSPIM